MGGVSGLVSGFSSGVSYMLFQSGVPLIVLSAATNISATGAITGLTALPYTPAGVVMVYCFAQAGLPSGIYFARFSSATACQLYTDDAGVIAPSGITPGAYSPTTATTSILTLPVLGNMIGPNGLMEVTADWIRPNTVNAMTITMMFGADPAITGTATTASTFGGRTTYRIRNRGVATRQIRFHPAGSNPGYAGTSIQTTTDTTVDQQMTLQVALSNTADFVILEGFSIEIQPSP